MTLEEEIKRCEEVAEERERAAREWHDYCGFPPIGDTQEEEDKCRESARECKQLAEWLKELKAYREQDTNHVWQDFALSSIPSDEMTLKQARQEVKNLRKMLKTQSEDAVSRKVVLDLAKKGILVSNGNYESVCKAINELPPVQPLEPCMDAISRKEVLKIIHSTIYDFMNESCDDEESPLTDKDKLLLSVNKAICNNLKSMNEQFEKNIREFEVKLESGVKIDSGPLLQRKNAAWEIKEDLIRRKEALEIIRTSDVWYAYTEKTPSDADIAFNFMKSKIKDLPSVQPKAKTGRWIISQNDCFVNCSECGLHGDKGIYKHYRYCPHCGAKMQESEG